MLILDILSQVEVKMILLTLIGNYFFTYLSNILFKLNISDVLFTYVMGKTKAFKELRLVNNDLLSVLSYL